MGKDIVLAYMKKHELPLNRQTYVSLNWGGSQDPSKPLEAELEAEIPEEFQLNKNRTD
jgi:hypothetical protein